MTYATKEEVAESKSRYESGDANAMDILILMATDEISEEDAENYYLEHNWTFTQYPLG